MRGLSDVGGIVSATIFRKNVNERRTVTSVGKTKVLAVKSINFMAVALCHTSTNTTGHRRVLTESASCQPFVYVKLDGNAQKTRHVT